MKVNAGQDSVYGMPIPVIKNRHVVRKTTQYAPSMKEKQQ